MRRSARKPQEKAAKTVNVPGLKEQMNVPSLEQQWRRATLTDKAQIISAFVTSVTLIAVAFQVADNHRLASITERQMLIASQQMGLQFAPNVRAISAALTRNLPSAHEPFGLSVVYKNIGMSRADDVHTVVYIQTRSGTTSVSQDDDFLVQGDSDVIEGDSAGWSPDSDYRMIVRINYRGSTDDGSTSSRRESCVAFTYSDAKEEMLQDKECPK